MELVSILCTSVNSIATCHLVCVLCIPVSRVPTSTSFSKVFALVSILLYISQHKINLSQDCLMTSWSTIYDSIPFHQRRLNRMLITLFIIAFSHKYPSLNSLKTENKSSRSSIDNESSSNSITHNLKLSSTKDASKPKINCTCSIINMWLKGVILHIIQREQVLPVQKTSWRKQTPP